MLVKINNDYKDYLIAQAMFGMESFKKNNKQYCELIKKLRKTPMFIAEECGDGLVVIDAISKNEKLDGIWIIDEKFLVGDNE